MMKLKQMLLRTLTVSILAVILAGCSGDSVQADASPIPAKSASPLPTPEPEPAKAPENDPPSAPPDEPTSELLSANVSEQTPAPPNAPEEDAGIDERGEEPMPIEFTIEGITFHGNFERDFETTFDESKLFSFTNGDALLKLLYSRIDLNTPGVDTRVMAYDFFNDSLNVLTGEPREEKNPYRGEVLYLENPMIITEINVLDYQGDSLVVAHIYSGAQYYRLVFYYNDLSSIEEILEVIDSITLNGRELDLSRHEVLNELSASE